MIEFLYLSAWPLSALSLGAAIACWRNARKLDNAKRGIRYTLAGLCLVIALIAVGGGAGVLPGLLPLALLAGALDGLLLTLLAREIVEAPGRKHIEVRSGRP